MPITPIALPPMASTLSDNIDNLLLRYLELLDQYTILRAQLGGAQSSFHQNIARANMAPDRGISRYGADRYDGRMQATRLCSITTSDSQLSELASDVDKVIHTDVPAEFGGVDTVVVQGKDDPIRMFAVLPPPTLRAAQKDAVDMVDIVPKLVSVNMEMQEIEIRVRRARKYKRRVEEREQVKPEEAEVGDASGDENPTAVG